MFFRRLNNEVELSIDIRCAVGNHKSRAIPEGLGFQQEGIIRKAEKVYGNHMDHVVYGLLRQESGR